MRACAVSRQKSRYLKLLAEAILEGTLDLAALSNLSDSKVADQLMQITGIGQWTADVYRLMCLARPDIWLRRRRLSQSSSRSEAALGETRPRKSVRHRRTLAAIQIGCCAIALASLSLQAWQAGLTWGINLPPDVGPSRPGALATPHPCSPLGHARIPRPREFARDYSA